MHTHARAQDVTFSVPGLSAVGDVFPTRFVEITAEKIDGFVAAHGDRNSMHTDDRVARKHGYRERIAPGLLCLAEMMGVAYVAGITDQSLFATMAAHFLQPVYPGDQISLRLVLKAQKIYARSGKRRVTLIAEIINQDEVVVASTEWMGLIKV